jgi:hypothetical protein
VQDAGVVPNADVIVAHCSDSAARHAAVGRAALCAACHSASVANRTGALVEPYNA